MPVPLSDFERAAPFAGDFEASLKGLQDRLAAIHLAQIVHRKRAIILFEGWEGSGKKDALKRLSAALDPCHFSTHYVGGSDRDSGQHWLARFWMDLPAAGHSTLYYRSWYRKVVDDRALGRVKPKDWARACDEINEFESQQRDHDTLVIKLFFHVSAEVQDQRLRQRGEDPWRKWLIEPEDLRSHSAHDRYLAAWKEIFKATDTRWAPWSVIDAGDERSAQIAALSAVVDLLEKAVSLDPPTDGDKVVMLAHQKFGQG